MTPKPKLLVALLSLVLCCSTLVSISGCSVLFPEPKVVQPDKPDNKPDNPTPAPTDPFNAKAGMAKALADDAVPHSLCVLLYGIYAGTADYAQGLPNDTDVTTTTLGESMEPMLQRVGWPQGKYLKVKAEISRIWTAMGFDDAKALSDSSVKQKLLDNYRLMADGCKDAAGRTK